MTPSIAGDCPTCNQAFTVEFSIEPRPNFLKCPTCEQAWDFGIVPLEGCPICGCRYFYRQKDFNQLLGCAIVLLGAVVVPAVTGYFLGYLLGWQIPNNSNLIICGHFWAPGRGPNAPKSRSGRGPGNRMDF